MPNEIDGSECAQREQREEGCDRSRGRRALIGAQFSFEVLCTIREGGSEIEC